MPQSVNERIQDLYLVQFGYLGDRSRNNVSSSAVSIDVEKKQAQAEFAKQQDKALSIQNTPSQVRQGITLMLFAVVAAGITFMTASTGLSLLAAVGIGAGAGFVGLSYTDPSLSWSVSKAAVLLPFRTVGAAGSLLLSRIFANKKIENSAQSEEKVVDLKNAKLGNVPKPKFESVDKSEIDVFNLPSVPQTEPYSPNPDMYDENKSIFDMKL